MEIIIGKTSGFCYGVKRAVEGCLENINNKNNSKIYCLGELIHNKQVIKQLQSNGIEIINDIKEINDQNCTLIIRTHGIEKNIYKKIENTNIKLVDYTCPNVLKVHNIASEYKDKNFYIFVIGTKNHPEVEGTISYCGNNFSVIEDNNDINFAIDKLKKSNLNNLLVIVQTTFSTLKFEYIKKEIAKRIDNNNINMIVKNTICLATEQRQKETEKIARDVEFMIVIGGKNSSNTKKLYEIALKNCKNAICIETIKDIDMQKLLQDFSNINKVGIMAGASTPQKSIDDVIEQIMLKKK